MPTAGYMGRRARWAVATSLLLAPLLLQGCGADCMVKIGRRSECKVKVMFKTCCQALTDSYEPVKTGNTPSFAPPRECNHEDSLKISSNANYSECAREATAKEIQDVLLVR
eukprot:TRINITY_DN93758_c0_g1_i1.p1 TRINITY_DN93758_c0_g1~~TRINITY_DN93758_c0_g1_i1.p1  ORF type:complete len:111 (+),score=9.15 TRINITY_DN93758_c0_g1_i1:57-389(+)